MILFFACLFPFYNNYLRHNYVFIVCERVSLFLSNQQEKHLFKILLSLSPQWSEKGRKKKWKKEEAPKPVKVPFWKRCIIHIQSNFNVYYAYRLRIDYECNTFYCIFIVYPLHYFCCAIIYTDVVMIIVHVDKTHSFGHKQRYCIIIYPFPRLLYRAKKRRNSTLLSIYLIYSHAISVLASFSHNFILRNESISIVFFPSRHITSKMNDIMSARQTCLLPWIPTNVIKSCWRLRELFFRF